LGPFLSHFAGEDKVRGPIHSFDNSTTND
jgi:hypothetical protein